MADDLLPPLPGLPPGACDCHVHIIGPRPDYPMVEARHYTPPEARTAELRAHLVRLGLTRAVIVQPSVYGIDNRCMLDSLLALGGNARGIAVLQETVDDGEIDRLDAAGVRGVRINLESASLRDPQAMAMLLDAWARRIARKGWHLQVYADLQVIAAAAGLLRRLPVPVVFDHFAMIPAGASPDDARVQAVLGLLRDGLAYVKLSAPYRLAGDGAVPDLARRLVETRPDRLLWGSDWPHTNREAGKAAHEVSGYRVIEPARMLADLHAWLPGTGLQRQVLVDNPARLYGF